jgi:hypothetical protein
VCNSYYLGVIDILQVWNLRKRAEHAFKAVRFVLKKTSFSRKNSPPGTVFYAFSHPKSPCLKKNVILTRKSLLGPQKSLFLARFLHVLIFFEKKNLYNNNNK